MKSLNILITASNYGPEKAGIGPYVTALADHLGDRGNRVVVGTTFPHYPEWRSSAMGRLTRTEIRGRVRVRRWWAYVPSTQSALHRAAYETTLYVFGLGAFPMRPRPDVVIGVCPSLAGGLLAATASALYRVPFGLVFQDLLGLAAEQSGFAGGGKVAPAVRTIELALAQRAARVGVIADGFRPYFEEGGVSPARIDRLRNWTRRTDPTETPGETRAVLGWGRDQFICLHAGNMGQKQGLDNLLKTAALVRGKGIRVILAGDGSDRPRLQAMAAELGLDNVGFLGPQAPGHWENLMQAADVLLVNQRAAVRDMSLPSKLTSYFAAGRPVIAAASAASETAREVVAAGAGLVAEPESPVALRDAIAKLKSDPERAASAGANARHYAANHLSSDAALADYEAFVERVAKNETAPASEAHGAGGDQPRV